MTEIIIATPHTSTLSPLNEYFGDSVTHNGYQESLFDHGQISTNISVKIVTSHFLQNF